MYRNYRMRSCNCGYNNNLEMQTEGIQEHACSEYDNTLDLNFDECACGYDEYNSFPTNPVLGQSYVPIQRMDKTFTPCVGLKMGTLFPELVSPYMPGQSMCEIEYLKATNPIKEGCNKC